MQVYEQAVRAFDEEAVVNDTGHGGHDIARAATSANPESLGAMAGSITHSWLLRAVNILLVTGRLRVLTVLAMVLEQYSTMAVYSRAHRASGAR